MNKLVGRWEHTIDIVGINYNCGHCGSLVGPSKHYKCVNTDNLKESLAWIFICPNCNKPTFMTNEKYYPRIQVPGEIFGENIEYLPPNVAQLYNEVRNCISVNAFTAAALACRKILMNVAVSKGAEPDKPFGFYVDFLDQNHFIPPDGRDWVDHIRNKGNEATHEIPSITRDDAIELLEFAEMLLRFVYELPGRMAKRVREKTE
mgnify:CR=1 FL=1